MDKKFILTAVLAGSAVFAFAGNVSVNLGGLGVSVGNGHHGTNVCVSLGCCTPAVVAQPVIVAQSEPVVVAQPPVIISRPAIVHQPVFRPAPPSPRHEPRHHPGNRHDPHGGKGGGQHHGGRR